MNVIIFFNSRVFLEFEVDVRSKFWEIIRFFLLFLSDIFTADGCRILNG